MTKNQIISELYDLQFVENYIKSIGNSLDFSNFNDIVQEIYLIICSLDEQRILSLYSKGGINAVRRLVAGIICRQVKSQTSTIYARYKKNAKNSEYMADDMEKYEEEVKNYDNYLNNKYIYTK